MSFHDLMSEAAAGGSCLITNIHQKIRKHPNCCTWSSSDTQDARGKTDKEAVILVFQHVKLQTERGRVGLEKFWHCLVHDCR